MKYKVILDTAIIFFIFIIIANLIIYIWRKILNMPESKRRRWYEIEKFQKSKCYKCEEQSCRLGNPSKCYDCENKNNTFINRALDIPGGNPKLFIGR
jgi:hypothetical protein